MRRKIKELSMIGTLLVAASCAETKQEAPALDFPERAGDASDATSSQSYGLVPAFGDTTIQIDLAKLPDYGSPNLWDCYQIPPADFLLGEAVCSDADDKKTLITAANVSFICSHNPEFVPRPAQAQTGLIGCEKIEIFLDRFEPKLNVKVGG